MAETAERKSLVTKLAEACDAVGGLEKKGRNKEQGYEYLKAADVAKAIRHELFSRGIVIVPNETEFSQERFQTNSGKSATECKLTVIYKVTDGVEILEFQAFATARDFSDKAIYKAKTGALKYFLRGLGLIPDEKDDPETESIEATPKEKQPWDESDEEFDQRTEGQRRIAQFQAAAFFNACKENGKTMEQIAAYLKQRFKIVQVEEMMRKDFAEAVKWAQKNGNPEDLTETLKTSVKSVAKKPAVNLPKLFATAREKGISEADVKQYIHETFGVEHSNEITPLQFNQAMSWINEVA